MISSHNSATEALRIVLDPGIVVGTDDQDVDPVMKDRTVSLRIKKQTLVNLTGMSGYGSMGEDGYLHFVFQVESVEDRDRVSWSHFEHIFLCAEWKLCIHRSWATTLRSYQIFCGTKYQFM